MHISTCPTVCTELIFFILLSFVQILQMINPRTNRGKTPSVALYFPLVRDYLSGFLETYKEIEIKDAIKKAGGATNQRSHFLTATSQSNKITKDSGTCKASVAILPRDRLNAIDSGFLPKLDSGALTCFFVCRIKKIYT